jgi:tRNA uridine 5-carboxymethylaminomethyl modification enzyme
LEAGRSRLKVLSVTPNEASRFGLKLNQDGQRRSAYDLLSYPDFSLQDLRQIWPELSGIDSRVADALEIEAGYAVYMQRQSTDIAQVKRDEDLTIPGDFDFDVLSGLSNELKHKLHNIRPYNVAQAAKIDGMTPAAISLLLVHLRRGVFSAAASG